jgi:hypothetical protein
MKKHMPGVILSLLALITVLIDCYVTRDFLGDSGIYFWFSVLLAGNIIRKVFLPARVLLTVLVNLVIIGMAMYCFRIVLLIGWGLCFTGRGITFMWGVVFVLNVVLPIEAAIEIARLRKTT